MKLRNLKRFKQDQQGWPYTSVTKSSYGYSTFFNEGPWFKFVELADGSITVVDRKFVRPKMTLVSWKRSAWRGL